MKAQLYTAPTIEPITLAELKTHLRVDSETFAGNLTTVPSIPPGSHGIHELMTLDVAPGGAGWAAGDTITGDTSHETCVIVQVLTATTYYVRDRSGAFTPGEVLSNGTIAADQGPAHPVFAAGYFLIGEAADVLGRQAVVNLNAGAVGAGGTVDAKIQDSDDGAAWADVTLGAFEQVTAANENAVQEKAYTGTKRYIRVAANVLGATCQFGADVIVNDATTVEDDDLMDLIVDGREAVEAITRRRLLTQTWDYYLKDWPKGGAIVLPFGCLQSVTAVSWKDAAGTETTLTVMTDYLVETNGDQCGRVVLPAGSSWPSGRLYPVNPIKVRFVCGWTAADKVPKNIKRAVKFIAEAAYYHGDRYNALKPAIDRLLAPWRLWEEF